jgi:hypothetical protein
MRRFRLTHATILTRGLFGQIPFNDECVHIVFYLGPGVGHYFLFGSLGID